MADISEILALVKIITFGIIILLALIYSLLILFNRRFHQHINILIVNICISMICTSTYYMFFFIMYQYYITHLFTEKICTFLMYIQSISTCQVPFSLTILTINRFCMIKCPNREFFKTKTFVAVCIASQWIVACIISLPFQINIRPYCDLFNWMATYTLVIVVIIPSLITFIFNLLIFKQVHSSSRRIQAQHDTNSVSTAMHQQRKMNRRDMSLLKHTIYMLALFIIGWGPIFLLVTIDFKGNVIPLVYTILQLLSAISSLSCMFDLFAYHHELRQFIKDKFFRCFC